MRHCSYFWLCSPASSSGGHSCRLEGTYVSPNVSPLLSFSSCHSPCPSLSTEGIRTCGSSFCLSSESLRSSATETWGPPPGWVSSPPPRSIQRRISLSSSEGGDGATWC